MNRKEKDTLMARTLHRIDELREIKEKKNEKYFHHKYKMENAEEKLDECLNEKRTLKQAMINRDFYTMQLFIDPSDS